MSPAERLQDGGKTPHTACQSFANIEDMTENMPPENECSERVAFYVRAYGFDAERNLKKQILELKGTYGEPAAIFKDKTPSWRENRTGLSSLLEKAKQKEFDKAAMTNSTIIGNIHFFFRVKDQLKAHRVSVMTFPPKPGKRKEPSASWSNNRSSGGFFDFISDIFDPSF